MKSGEYISELQYKYWKRMNDNGFKLEEVLKIVIMNISLLKNLKN